MAEKRRTKDLFTDMTDYRKSEPAQPTTEPIGYEPLKQRQIRMSDNDWQALKAHFKGKGISVSGGIRMVLKRYIHEEIPLLGPTS